MIRKVLGAFLLLFLAAISQGQNLEEKKIAWVDSVYKALTLDQRLGQLFLFPVYGNGNETHLNVVKNTIDRYTLGGIRLMDGNLKSVVQKVSTLQKRSGVPLITSISIDGGLGEVLDKTIKIPNALTLGAIQSDTLLFNIGQEMGRQLDIIGVNMVFHSGLVPADEKSNGLSYSSNSSLSLKKDSLIAKGLTTYDVILTRSDFPGIRADALNKNKRDLIRNNMAHYDLISESAYPAIMVSPLMSALDNKRPASLSSNTLDYLKKDMTFNGLIIADNFNKLKKYKPGKTEAAAISAGNDMVISSNVNSSIKQLKKLIRKEKISFSSIEKSVRKILEIKYHYKKGKMNQENIELKVNDPQALALIDKAYRSSVTVIDKSKVLPIHNLDTNNFASISFGNGIEFNTYLDKYARFTHYNSTQLMGKSIETFSLYNYVVVGLFSEKLTSTEIEFINSINAKHVIVCSFTNPYELAELNANTKIISYSSEKEMQIIVPQVIFGAVEAKGRLPLNVSKELPLNAGINTSTTNRLSFGKPEEVRMDSRVLNKVNDIVYEAISDKATPGAQVLVSRKGKIVFYENYGHYTYDSIKEVRDHTIYDLASITKVAATTHAVMFLEERGIIDLDKKISVYLTDLKGTNKENMTIRDILTHQAGLWPYLPFWKQTLEDSLNIDKYYSSEPLNEYQHQISDGLYSSDLTRDSIWFWVKKSKLRKKESRIPYDYKYSDMGYYMLQRLIENKLNQPMEEFLQQNFYDPLGLKTMSYLPLCKSPLSHIAPTEYDNYFRKTLVYGLVHDQGAAMMGGVAGHAGLFSNAIDLAKLMQMNLQGGNYGGEQYFRKETLEKFTSIQYNNNRRGIGWDKPVVAEMNSPASPYASKKAFGHSGFTGTIVWVDPEFDLIYVFLSNRIYPDATNRKLIKNNIRTRIQDLIYQSMWSYSLKYDGRVN